MILCEEVSKHCGQVTWRKEVDKQVITSQGKLGWLGEGHSYRTDLLLAWFRDYINDMLYLSRLCLIPGFILI